VKKTLAVLAIAVLSTAALHAQATRTWVSGVGDDVNPCSRTAPCKTFAGAISKTAAGGEISVLDPGGFGAVTITKSISIIADGSEGSILAAATNGIIINAAANDVVHIRGLMIEGALTGLNGIRFLAGGSLHIEKTLIRGFNASTAGNGHGINFAPSGASKLFLDEVTVANNGTGTNGGGILIKPTGTGSATAVIKNSNIDRNIFGIKVEAGGAGAVKLEIVDSATTQSGFSGLTANGTLGPAQIFASRVTTSNNGTTGVQANGSLATVRISDCTIYNNGIGLQVSAAGQIITSLNNSIRGNGVDGGVTGNEPLQ
jgi:hypothetical protein